MSCLIDELMNESNKLTVILTSLLTNAYYNIFSTDIWCFQIIYYFSSRMYSLLGIESDNVQRERKLFHKTPRELMPPFMKWFSHKTQASQKHPLTITILWHRKYMHVTLLVNLYDPPPYITQGYQVFFLVCSPIIITKHAEGGPGHRISYWLHLITSHDANCSSNDA